jgi:hypothetical protein
LKLNTRRSEETRARSEAGWNQRRGGGLAQRVPAVTQKQSKGREELVEKWETEWRGTHAFVDAAPHIEVLAGAVRLARGVLLDALGAALVRGDERGALGLARLLEVGPVVNGVFDGRLNPVVCGGRGRIQRMSAGRGRYMCWMVLFYFCPSDRLSRTVPRSALSNRRG